MTYDPEKFEKAALAGDVMSAISVLSRSALKPELREALMVPGAHREVLLGIMSRSDVTSDQLDWIAQHSEDTYVLNRTAAHGKASTATIRRIRERAIENQDQADTWRYLAEFTARRLKSQDPRAVQIHVL